MLFDVLAEAEEREREKEIVFVDFWKEREWVNAAFDHCMSSSTTRGS